MLNDLDHPCTCGHLKGHHVQHPPELPEFKWTMFFHYCTIEFCNCDNFLNDNLEYLKIVHTNRERQRSKGELE